MPPLIELGEARWFIASAMQTVATYGFRNMFKAINDEHGQPMELVGAWADVSERRRAEQQALEANAELQETAPAQPPDRELARRHYRHGQERKW